MSNTVVIWYFFCTQCTFMLPSVYQCFYWKTGNRTCFLPEYQSVLLYALSCLLLSAFHTGGMKHNMISCICLWCLSSYFRANHESTVCFMLFRVFKYHKHVAFSVEWNQLHMVLYVQWVPFWIKNGICGIYKSKNTLPWDKTTISHPVVFAHWFHPGLSFRKIHVLKASHGLLKFYPMAMNLPPI